MSAPKKETIYSGPAVVNGNSYSSTATKPVKETIYSGPAPGAEPYNDARPAGTTYSRPAADAGASPGVAKSANAFFLIAFFSLINTVLLSSHAMAVTAIGLGVTRVMFIQALGSGAETTPVFLLSGVLIAAFAGLGLLARRGSGLAFLIGLLLYGADTGILCWDGIGEHIPSLIIHVVFLGTILNGYRLTRE